MTSQPRRVAVIGGGIAGLTSALAFARNGAEAIVFEQASEIAEVGAGLQVTPNGARVLGALGLATALERAGVAAGAVVPMDALSGRAVARFPLADAQPRYRFVHRAALIGLLHDACLAAGVTVRTGQRMDAANFPDADLVVGADGLHSVLRGRLNRTVAPFFTGQVAWRAIVPGAHPSEARIWMAPGRHLVSYPLAPDRINLVAVEERTTWAEDGWHHADDPANLRAAFAGLAPEVSGLLAGVKQAQLWGLFRHEIAPRWHDGHAALVGDAAHPTLPFLAQGANLALEDALVLARAVASLGQGPGLAAYVAARRHRVQRAIAAANANAVNYHLGGLRRRGAHLALGLLGHVAPGAFVRRLDWLYNYDAATVRF